MSALASRIHRKAVEFGLLPVGGAGKARVLMYHGIGDPGCSAVNVRHIGTDLFDRHLRMFRERFNVVSLDELCAGARDPRHLTVALTFDDGLRNNLTHALPLLEKHRVPATFFISGANPQGLPSLWGDLADLAPRLTDRKLTIAGERFVVDRNGRYGSERDGTLLNDRIKQLGGSAPKVGLYEQLRDLFDGPLDPWRMFWQLMSDEELRQVARHPLISLGSHGWWHNDMGRIPLADAEEELRKSREYLAELSGRPVTAIAWPAGSYSAAVVEAAARMGVHHQFAVTYADPGDRSDPRLWDRYGVYDFPVRERYFLHLIARGAR